MINKESIQDSEANYKNGIDNFARIKDKLLKYHPINFEILRDLSLMSRYDTKFIFHIEKLSPIFEHISDLYKIVEIDNERAPGYENLYYDTDDLLFYHQHHNQRVNRYKIRFRKYIDTNSVFFEIKCKNNKKKTSKVRSPLKETDLKFNLSEDLKEYVKKNVSLDDTVIDNIKPALKTAFNRITFASLVNKERITFDINLIFSDAQNHNKRINNLVIAELKQKNYSFASPVFKCFKHLKIYPTRFSKYCIGTATMEMDVKCNRFKSQLLTLNKINQGEN